MTHEQAIVILVNSARIAQSKGVFTLEDANVVLEAVKVLSPKTDSPVTGTESPKEEVLDKKE